jgi:acyl-CoA dehydrogenase
MDRLWEALVREFCAAELRPYARDWAQAGTVDRDLWRRAGKAGLLCPDVPAEYGGGRDFRHETVVVREQALVGDTAWGYTAHEVVAQYVLRHGTDEQRNRWLPGLASGELVGAVAITEPGAGSDLGALRSAAVRDGDSYRLDGTKTLITNGCQANLIVVFALVDGSPSVLVVDTRGNDVQRTRIDKIGRRGQDTAELVFAGHRLPVGDVLGGRPGEGAAQSAPMLNRERLLIAVGAAAAIEAVVGQAVAWAGQRRVFGRRLRRFQHTRFLLAECATEAAVTGTFVEAMVRRYLDDELDLADAAMVKLWATERLARVADRCLQLYGGVGYTAGHPAAEAWADARATRVYGGANEVMTEIVSASLGRPRAAR